MADEVEYTEANRPVDDTVQKPLFDSDENEENEETSEQPRKSRFSDEVGNLKFVNFIVRYPCAVFASLMGFCILITIILFALNKSSGSPFTTPDNEYDLKDVRSVAYDSLALARDKVKGLDEDETRDINAKVQEDVGDITYWIYEAKTDDGIFTKEGIPHMREAEDTIRTNTNYDEYCVLDYDTTDAEAVVSECRKPLSVLNIYYASVWNSTLAQEVIEALTPEMRNIFNEQAPCVKFGGIQCDNPRNETLETSVKMLSDKIDTMIDTWDGMGDLNKNVDEVTKFIAYINELETKQSNVNFFFDKNFNINNTVTQYSRSIIWWGELLNGTKDEDESEKELIKFIKDDLLKSWNKITGSNNGEVKTYFFQLSLIFDIILGILAADALKALASFLAVFFYLRLMIGSWFLAAIGMFEIFMSLPLAWFTFSYIFQIKYFSALNVLCIFIVIAIGADDIFVFMDAYKQSATKGKDVVSSLETRMSWVFRRSGWAMLLTSTTTFSAFLITLTSPIASTKSFGIFAAFVIVFDYLLVMTLYCTAVVIYHNLFETKLCCCSCVCWIKNDPTPTEIALEKDETGDVVELDRISRFFKSKLGPFILNGRNRIFIAIPLVTLITITAIYSFKLKATTTQEQFLADDHPLQQASTILDREFPTTQEDPASKIFFVWGLENVNRKGVNQLLKPDSIGKPVFVEDFEFNEECQRKMLDACQTLRTHDKFEEFIVQEDGLRIVDCFVEELGAFNALDETNNDTDTERCIKVKAQDWVNTAWQVAPSNLTSTMKSFVSTGTCYDDDDDNISIEEYYKDSMGWDGSNLRYAGISLDSTILDPFSNSAEKEVRRHYDTFIKFAKELDGTMGGACQSKTIMTDLDQGFVFMNNQRIYGSTAFTGAFLGVVIAFLVLLISTRKLHVSVFACLSILAVLVGVIGSTTIFGWTLGITEAILISILAGFSVDYVIHLAHAYVHAEGNTDERIIAAYSDMGISVFSGMLTSVVASIPLFFCTLTFFAKFGTFLCTTIVFSWIFANFGFMCLLAQFKIPITNKWW